MDLVLLSRGVVYSMLQGSSLKSCRSAGQQKISLFKEGNSEKLLNKRECFLFSERTRTFEYSHIKSCPCT